MKRMHFYVLSVFLLVALGVISSSSFFVKEELLVCRKLDNNENKILEEKYEFKTTIEGCLSAENIECIKSKNSVKLYFQTCQSSSISEKEVSLCRFNKDEEKLLCMNSTILAKPILKKESKIPG